MILKVNEKLYECLTSARTVINYWQYYKTSFLNEWNKCLEVFGNEQTLLLKQLFYISANIKESFEVFEDEADNDENFVYTAFLLKSIIFDSSIVSQTGSSEDYGIPSDEITFLANMLICRIPDCWLDQFKYYEIVEIIKRKGLIENQDNYSVSIMSEAELDNFDGITAERENSISEYIKAHPEEFELCCATI